MSFLTQGKIWPINLSFDVPMLFQEKHDISMHMSVDYRELNKVTVKNKYLISLISILFDRLSKTEYFTKLDLQSGYW